MQLKESVNSRCEEMRSELAALKIEMQALRKENEELKAELQSRIERNEKDQLVSLLEKTEKLKIQEKLSNMIWLQSDEKYLVKLIEQKFRGHNRQSVSRRSLEDIVSGANSSSYMHLYDENKEIGFFISKDKYVKPREEKAIQTITVDMADSASQTHLENKRNGDKLRTLLAKQKSMDADAAQASAKVSKALVGAGRPKKEAEEEPPYFASGVDQAGKGHLKIKIKKHSSASKSQKSLGLASQASSHSERSSSFMLSMTENPQQQPQTVGEGEDTPLSVRQPFNVVKSVHKKSLREL